MPDWYHLFIGSVVLLWLGASPRDRAALRVVLLATLISELLVTGVTRQIPGAWKLVLPGTVEMATIFALLHWARNRTGYMQVGCLVVAWFAHVLCFADLAAGTDIVYSRYEATLGLVAIAQLAACYDTIIHNWRKLGHWFVAPRLIRSGAVRSSSVRSRLLPDSRSPNL